MSDEKIELQKRDRLRRRLAAQKTPAQHLAEMEQLQRQIWELLRALPASWDHFIRRNFKKRAIHVPPSTPQDNVR